MNLLQRWVLAGISAGGFAMASAAMAADSVFLTAPLPSGAPKVSQAADARLYRVDAARHIYESYPVRIFRGKLPPLIHAIVVVEVIVDANGLAKEINIVRGPSHAPDVTAAVQEMIRRVLPLPAPSSLGGAVSYTDTWLVDKSGRFQLDTLSEGQY